MVNFPHCVLFTATQILREINFGHIKPPKTASFTTFTPLNFEFLEVFDTFKYEISQKSKFKASKSVKMEIFDLLRVVKIGFT